MRLFTWSTGAPVAKRPPDKPVTDQSSNKTIEALPANPTPSEKPQPALQNETPTGAIPVPESSSQRMVSELMGALKERIKSKQFHWDLSLFTHKSWEVWGFSVNKRPLIYWRCGQPSAQNASLILSAVHGDEITPVYFGFRLGGVFKGTA